MISKEFIRAYTQTNYVFPSPSGDLVIRIGNPHPAVDALLSEQSATEWTIITAWNPFSQLLSEQENADRQNRLKEEVAAAELWYMDGAGIGDDATWPPEASMFITGISKVAAETLGRKFEQNAIVYGRKGEKAELLDCTINAEGPHSQKTGE